MRFRNRAALAAAIAASVLATPYAASSSTIVFGKGFANTCSIMALKGLSDTRTFDTCNRAINEDMLNSSDYAKTLVNRGVVQMRRKNIDHAERDFAQAQTLLPDLPEVYINRAVIQIKQGRYADAIALIDQGLALAPDEPEKAYFNRALAREAAGDVTGAYYDFTKASTLKPEWEAPKKELVRFNVQRAG